MQVRVGLAQHSTVPAHETSQHSTFPVMTLHSADSAKCLPQCRFCDVPTAVPAHDITQGRLLKVLTMTSCSSCWCAAVWRSA